MLRVSCLWARLIAEGSPHLTFVYPCTLLRRSSSALVLDLWKGTFMEKDMVSLCFQISFFYWSTKEMVVFLVVVDLEPELKVGCWLVGCSRLLLRGPLGSTVMLVCHLHFYTRQFNHEGSTDTYVLLLWRGFIMFAGIAVFSWLIFVLFCYKVVSE